MVQIRLVIIPKHNTEEQNSRIAEQHSSIYCYSVHCSIICSAAIRMHRHWPFHHPLPLLPLLNVGTSTQVIQKSINELTAKEVDAVLLPEVALRVFLPHVWTATGAGMDEDCRDSTTHTSGVPTHIHWCIGTSDSTASGVTFKS